MQELRADVEAATRTSRGGDAHHDNCHWIRPPQRPSGVAVRRRYRIDDLPVPRGARGRRCRTITTRTPARPDDHIDAGTNPMATLAPARPDDHADAGIDPLITLTPAHRRDDYADAGADLRTTRCRRCRPDDEHADKCADPMNTLTPAPTR